MTKDNMKYIVSFAFIIVSLLVSGQQKQRLTLEDFITRNTFAEQTPSKIKPMNDGNFFTTLEDETRIVKYSFKDGKVSQVILDITKIKDAPIHHITEYTFSNSENRILLGTNPKKIFRHSYTAEYYIWDFYTEKFYALSEYGPQQVPSFSPDGERVAFVRDNNLFVKTIKFGTEYAVTGDGMKNKILNGIPDWVYEEEFSYNKAYEWSPDSRQLAFVKFNETEVPLFSMQTFKGLTPERKENSLYPGETSLKYPKAGEKNSKVSVHVHDLKSKTTLEMNTGDNGNIYIPRILWNPKGSDLGIMVLNRRQSELTYLYANPNTGDARTIFTERNSKYIDEEFLANLIYLPDNEHFVITSERDGWSHLYLYKNSGFFVQKVTSGNFDVTSFYGYDAGKKTFYYQAAKKSPLQREVYMIGWDGKETCLTNEPGTSEALFSSNFQYFLNIHSNALTPSQVVIYDAKGKKVRVLSDNAQLINKLKNYTLPNHTFFQFTTSEGITLNGYMLKPSTFDASNKYPVLMTQYSGPNSQEVTDSWKINWHWYLAEQGYVVVCVDPRGTAARGEEFRKCTYLQLGKLETDDLIETAKYLATLPYIQVKNMAIWGWSYGGFTTALCMARGNGIFNTGIAVAPVTNWRFYDTAYTERFMRTPIENPNGYDDNSPISHAANMKGNFLLIHGTADENVHAQNTYEFAEAMVQAGIPFDMHLYTNRNHSIYGGNTRLHLYTKIIRYLDEHLKQ